MRRAKFHAPNCNFPPDGATGNAFRAAGWGDALSAEFRAWLFQPDGDENAYYCEQSDLEFI